MSSFIDNNGDVGRPGVGRGLFGAGRFFTAQFGALSSARKLNSTDPDQLTLPLEMQAQAKLETFRQVVSQHMAQGRMMQDSALAGAVLKAGKKKSCFGPVGVGLAHEALEAIRDHAERDGAGLFLISGTLLGPVRDGQLLAHDYDLDFGVFSDDPCMEKLEHSLRKDARFEVCKVFKVTPELALYNQYMRGHIGKPLKYTILYKGIVTVDIFVHLRFKGVAYHGTDRNIWLNSAFSLAPLRMGGQTYLAPGDREIYLEENYGNWRVPVTDYHCATDTPNAGTVVSYRALLSGIKNYMRFKRVGDDRRAGIIHEQINAMGDDVSNRWNANR